MALAFPRWSARGLLAAWSIYWVALLAIGGRSLMRIISFASSAPKGRGTVTAGLNDGLVQVVARLDGHQVLGGSMSVMSLALLIAGPPLALWALWLIQRPRREALPSGERQPLLPHKRWTPTTYHEALRREDLRERQEP